MVKGGAEGYLGDLSNLDLQLREFLAHANGEFESLQKRSEMFEDGCLVSSRMQALLRMRPVVFGEADAATQAEARREALHETDRELQEGVAAAGLAKGRLLLHCNLLLDCQRRVQRAEAHLKELHGLVNAGHGVEVTHRWRTDAHGEIRSALINLAARLELFSRDLLSQREGARSSQAVAEKLKERIPALRAEVAVLEREAALDRADAAEAAAAEAGGARRGAGQGNGRPTPLGRQAPPSETASNPPSPSVATAGEGAGTEALDGSGRNAEVANDADSTGEGGEAGGEAGGGAARSEPLSPLAFSPDARAARAAAAPRRGGGPGRRGRWRHIEP